MSGDILMSFNFPTMFSICNEKSRTWDWNWVHSCLTFRSNWIVHGDGDVGDGDGDEDKYYDYYDDNDDDVDDGDDDGDTGSPSTGNQLYGQPKHRQPVIQAVIQT